MDNGPQFYKAIFIDKDGVIVDNSCYPTPPSDKLLPQAVKGLETLSSMDYKVIIISNQSWIGKGKLSVQEVESIFQSLTEQLNLLGVSLTAWYTCPHIKEEGCECRKPSSHLILKASQEHHIDLSESYFIGDMTSDILAGKRAGTTTILVKTGQSGEDNRYPVKPDYTFPTFTEAIYHILKMDLEEDSNGKP